MSIGHYFWNITCWDDLNNTNTSLMWIFNISTIFDFTLNASEIIFNTSEPIESSDININATIYNLGSTTVYNLTVQFYDGDPLSGGVMINTNVTIAELGGNNQTRINITWVPSLGLHNIWVVIDPIDEFSELNETNNNATNNVTIPSWHYVYGNLSGNLILQDLINKSVFTWNASDIETGNIFVVDVDSYIDWLNITEIGVNLTGGNESDDFEEIDTSLNSTSYPDNINITYTDAGKPKNTTSLIVFKELLQFVPIANSTNNTNFFTGILWDSSDNNPGQYNGSQDLIFVTRINRDQPCRYGTCDFEMRIPSELKEYKTPDVYSVAFYSELK
jgi:hypothetical protein